MEFNLLFNSFFFISVAILVPCAKGREAPREALVAVLKGETMNEAIQDLLGRDASNNQRVSLPTSKTMCNDHPVAEQRGSKQFADNIEPRPDVTAYRDDDFGLQGKKTDLFIKDIEPRPDATSYRDELLGLEGKKRFTDDIEPRPDVTSYRDELLGHEGKKRFTDDIEPRPDVTAYEGKEGKHFKDDFEPRPDVTKYEE